MTVDAFRGAAAIAVLIGHTVEFSPINGLFAVDLFFMLSGFIICFAYEGRLSGGLCFKAFIILRLIRLWPLYLLGTVAAMAIGQAFPAQTLDGTIGHRLVGNTLNLFFLPSPYSNLLYPANPPAWSLSLELVANAAYALTWRHWNIRNLLILLPVSFTALIVSRLCLHSFDTGFNWANAAGGVARVAYGFPIGVLIFRLMQNARFRSMWPSLPVPVLLVMELACFSVTGQGTAGQAAQFLVPLLIPFLLIGGAVSEPRACMPLYLHLGAISYSVYILQWPILTLCKHLTAAASNFPSILLSISMVLVFSCLFHSYLDVPFRASLRNRVRPVH